MAEPRPDDRVFGAFALALFAAGVLLPCITKDGLDSAQGFTAGIAAEILAIFMGAFGWRERTAKVAAISAISLLIVAVLAYVLFGAQASDVSGHAHEKMNFM